MLLPILFLILGMGLCVVGDYLFLVKNKKNWLIFLFFGLLLIIVSMPFVCKQEPSKSKRCNNKHNQTVVLFDNGNGRIDTLLFDSDTIHANSNNIW